MPKLSYQNQSISTMPGEKVLDAFLRQGISIPFSCRDGVCHSCKQIAVSGRVQEEAQKGLTSIQREQGFFLPCVCVPAEDMVIQSPQEAMLYAATIIQGKELLTGNICKLLLEPTLAQPCRLGQFVNLRSGDAEARSYAIANQPEDEYFIELHIPLLEGDRYSKRVFEELAIGDEMDIQGPFDQAPVPRSPSNIDPSVSRAETSRPKDPPPDLALWQALQGGKLLRVILEDFYGRVYKDELLSPYFHGITMQRSIEKVYSFLQQIFTGEKCYFGDRPKNAHHWMVISEETFKYREALMIECQRRAGMSEEMISRWIAIEGYYKQDIVKAEPWKRVVGGVELPLEGFGEMILDSGAICDGCGRIVEVGESVRYHLRIGSMYCTQCNGPGVQTGS